MEPKQNETLGESWPPTEGDILRIAADNGGVCTRVVVTSGGCPARMVAGQIPTYVMSPEFIAPLVDRGLLSGDERAGFNWEATVFTLTDRGQAAVDLMGSA